MAGCVSVFDDLLCVTKGGTDTFRLISGHFLRFSAFVRGAQFLDEEAVLF